MSDIQESMNQDEPQFENRKKLASIKARKTVENLQRRVFETNQGAASSSTSMMSAPQKTNRKAQELKKNASVKNNRTENNTPVKSATPFITSAKCTPNTAHRRMMSPGGRNDRVHPSKAENAMSVLMMARVNDFSKVNASIDQVEIADALVNGAVQVNEKIQGALKTHEMKTRGSSMFSPPGRHVYHGTLIDSIQLPFRI
jgi:hypothetical protein